MKVGVWRTGHEIADTVAKAVHAGMPSNLIPTYADVPQWGKDGKIYGRRFSFPSLNPTRTANIAYGILRGADNVFRQSDEYKIPWFNIDRGYWKPGHYDGYYRVSLCGTQQTTGLDKLESDYERWRALGIELKPWRGLDRSKPVLICPPTEPVREFFGVDAWEFSIIHDGDYEIRPKGSDVPINFDAYSHVITFNSSVGWQALAAGIPCISDPTHSIVGAWFKNFPLEELEEAQYKERERLFASMSSLQLTLNEMREGKLWDVMRRLMSISGSIPANQSHPM